MNRTENAPNRQYTLFSTAFQAFPDFSVYSPASASKRPFHDPEDSPHT